jgi:hypothetical protein
VQQDAKRLAERTAVLLLMGPAFFLTYPALDYLRWDLVKHLATQAGYIAWWVLQQSKETAGGWI